MPDHTPAPLSVVVPVYGAEHHIAEFCRRMSKAARAITPHYEIILVNDASPDKSLMVLQALAANDVHLKVINHQDNQGQIKALYTGLQHAKGDMVFTIDDDMEESPEWISLFYDTWKNSQPCDIVFGAQPVRHANWFVKLTGFLTFFVMNKLCNANIVPNVLTCRLLTRRCVDAILAHGDNSIPYCLMCYQTGLPYHVVEVQKKPQANSGYTVFKRCKFALLYFWAYWRMRHTLGRR